MEAGLRYEQQKGSSDVGVKTFESQTFSPRLALSYDLLGNGKTLLIGTAGRFYQFLVQDYSDEFANVPQQGAYTVFLWNGSEFEAVQRVDPSANNLQPAEDLDPTHMDEVTLGFEQQIGNTIGLTVRGVFREWDDLIDDVIEFDAEGNQVRFYENYEAAERDYMGVEFVFDKRFSDRWSANLNYTWSETQGNHFSSFASTLGDYIDSQCQSTVDPTIGNGGNISCAEVQDGAGKVGNASYDRPHYVKAITTYNIPLGRVNLNLGAAANWRSGLRIPPRTARSTCWVRTGCPSPPRFTFTITAVRIVWSRCSRSIRHWKPPGGSGGTWSSDSRVRCST